jgi:uncharacterized protein
VKSPSSVEVRFAAGETSASTTALVYEAHDEAIGAALILAHGAGAGQKSAFMTEFARALSAVGVDVVTFNFLYVEQRRKIPDRAPTLEACYRAVIDAARRRIASARTALFIGGKSMGGRIATQVVAGDDALPLGGLVLLGYPLHPPGRPDERRDKHLPLVRRPMLIVQGSRDPFGTPAELAPLVETLDPRPTVYVIDGGDHSFKVGRTDPAAQRAVYANAQHTIVNWIGSLAPGRTRRTG